MLRENDRARWWSRIRETGLDLARRDVRDRRAWAASDFLLELQTIPWATLSLIASLVMVHAMMPAGADLLFRAERRAILDGGEWYRVITAPLIHLNLAHLLGNCWSLLLFGWLGERVFGARRMLAIFIGSAVLGVVATLVAFDHVWVIGSSDGLTALSAALLPFTMWQWSRLKPVFKRALAGGACVLLFVLYQDQRLTDVNAYAHLPGLVFGLIAGLYHRRGVPGISETTLRPDTMAHASAKMRHSDGPSVI